MHEREASCTDEFTRIAFILCYSNVWSDQWPCRTFKLWAKESKLGQLNILSFSILSPNTWDIFSRVWNPFNLSLNLLISLEELKITFKWILMLEKSSNRNSLIIKKIKLKKIWNTFAGLYFLQPPPKQPTLNYCRRSEYCIHSEQRFHPQRQRTYCPTYHSH